MNEALPNLGSVNWKRVKKKACGFFLFSPIPLRSISFLTNDISVASVKEGGGDLRCDELGDVRVMDG